MTATITEIEVVEASEPKWEEELCHAVCAWHDSLVMPIPICGTNDPSGWAPEGTKIDCPMCRDMIESNVRCPKCGKRMQDHAWEWAL